ncbi:hypothetical protein Metbo_1141 [Methanobacterium lacus]|uniref:Uncharacterized protein n=2 Tax=Methanobacterium lacus (strain AL-21) TaxID=877455 RepID=F0T5Z2_METLA|nr:hypothetical protein Metbo_1141 [Methanobacterium lacus]
MAYLVCDKCGGYYELQPGESPDDFDRCECGGKLKYLTNLDYLSDDFSDYSSSDNSIDAFPKSTLNEREFIKLFWELPIICFFMVGFFVMTYGLSVLSFQFINMHNFMNDFYTAIFIFLILIFFIILCLVGVLVGLKNIRNRYSDWYKEMNWNYRAIGVAFIVTIGVIIFGAKYLPNNFSLIGPLIGGLLAGYMVGINRGMGFVHGGISAGVAGCIGFLLPSLIYKTGLPFLTQTRFDSLILIVLIFAVIYFMVFFILGSIGGTIGTLIKLHSTQKNK